MDVEWVRQYCLTLPHTTHTVQWVSSLVFKVGGKMYAVVSLEPGKYWMSFKCSAEDFAELTERPGIDPAPYLARAQWVALAEDNVLPRRELKALIRSAYDQVYAKLPKKVQSGLNNLPTSDKRT
jgi:predicted DNA-binding protein (MmcQ/YjbR family)